MDRMRELVDRLNETAYQYYTLDAPTISDAEWDRLYDELVRLENETGERLPDSPTRRVGGEVLSVFEEIRRDFGTTVMMITHNPEIARMADRVIKLRDGRVSSIKVNLHPLHASELVW